MQHHRARASASHATPLGADGEDLRTSDALGQTTRMGLIGDWFRSKNMKDPVRGTLQVTASSYPPDSATSANFSLNGVVSGDGIPPTAVEHAGIAKTRKWPHAGQQLPVVVDRADPMRIDIQWDELADSWDTARQGAQALAAQMRGEAPDGATTSGAIDDAEHAKQRARILDSI